MKKATGWQSAYSFIPYHMFSHPRGIDMMRMCIAVALVQLSLIAMAAGQTGTLQSSFRTPADTVHPWVYWVWMDGNVSREGATADLEAMKRVGIGGVIIMEVNVGIPQGSVKFMSPEWRQHFKYVVAEAERLGLQITLMTGPGWTGSGGPWVTPEQGMQHLVTSTTTVSGPKHFEDVLPRPARRPAFFGDGALPPALEKEKNDFYRDVAVLAYPTPSGEERIAGIDEKALYVRAPYSSQTSVPSFIPSPAHYPATPPGGAIDQSLILDLSDRIASGGKFIWDVPEGDWTILRLGRTSTGANTRPAPVPGLGLESDKLDTAALNAHFDAFIGTLLRELGPRNSSLAGGWKMLHIDSWEMGAQNWSGAFREEFRNRRGYDLLKYLPVLTGSVVGNREISERFLWDLRQTVQELILQNHAGHLKELGRRNGFGLSIEPYDMTPCADMSLGSLADVPMCEFWLYGFNTSHSVIEAASIAHTCGQTVVAAESFTSSDLEHWDAYPGSMKVLGDWAFCAGVNRFVFHRYQHQPWLNLRPGMTMGPYGVHWERTQTWWDLAPGYHTYLSRCQLMLRQGLSVADVCYLVPEGAPQVFRPPASAVRGNPPDRRGYNFDGCAPEVLIARMSVQNGELVLPDGMRYNVLVLPDRETMTPVLLRKVKRLIEEGATVIGRPPGKSPGLSGYPECDREVSEIAGQVWGDCDGVQVTEHAFGKGKVIWVRSRESEADSLPAFSADDEPGGLMRLEASPTALHAGLSRQRTKADGKGNPEREQYCEFGLVEKVLYGKGLQPDFETQAQLRYTHRRVAQTDIYFIANPEDHVVTAQCKFRVSGKQPEIWDPVEGDVRELPEFTDRDGRTSTVLRFEPHQSMFVVFAQTSGKKHPAGGNFRQFNDGSIVRGPWEVTFDSTWGGPGSMQFQDLDDWSTRKEDGVRFFSGVATYKKTFDLPAEASAMLSSGEGGRSGVWLDLGEVKNLASVRLNGRDLGVLWTPPWRVNIGPAVRSKGNVLEVSVANLWRNRLVGDERLPQDAEFADGGNILRWPEWLAKGEPRPSSGRFSFSTWRHFTEDSPLLPSGLIGPVRIIQPLP
jgi:hypothetical protein